MTLAVSSWIAFGDKNVIVKDEESTANQPTLKDLCSLPLTGSEGFVDGDTAVFWDLCPKVKKPKSVFPPEFCEDSSANVCLVKVTPFIVLDVN